MVDHLQPGDRVQVKTDHWDAQLVGRTGTVATYPAEASQCPRCVWVDLDVAEWKPGVIDGAEVEAEFLAPIRQ